MECLWRSTRSLSGLLPLYWEKEFVFVMLRFAWKMFYQIKYIFHIARRVCVRKSFIYELSPRTHYTMSQNDNGKINNVSDNSDPSSSKEILRSYALTALSVYFKWSALRRIAIEEVKWCIKFSCVSLYPILNGDTRKMHWNDSSLNFVMS